MRISLSKNSELSLDPNVGIARHLNGRTNHFFYIWLQVACIISIYQSWYITVIQYEQVIETHT